MKISPILLYLFILFLIMGCTRNVSELKQDKSIENQQTTNPKELEKIDFSRCTKDISYPQTSNYCIISYFVPRLKSLAVCNQMFELDYNKQNKNALYDKFTCYVNVASETENHSICNQISITNLKTECEGKINDWKIGIAVCDNKYADNKDMKYFCYKEFAIHNSDVSICEKIPDIWDEQYKQYNQNQQKINCFNELAVKLKDSSICEKIKYGNDYCYSAVTAELNNS